MKVIFVENTPSVLQILSKIPGRYLGRFGIPNVVSQNIFKNLKYLATVTLSPRSVSKVRPSDTQIVTDGVTGINESYLSKITLEITILSPGRYKIVNAHHKQRCRFYKSQEP